MPTATYNSIYKTLQNALEEYHQKHQETLYDPEMNELASDFIKILRDVERWQNGDCAEHLYRIGIKEFKDKWFTKNPKPKEPLFASQDHPIVGPLAEITQAKTTENLIKIINTAPKISTYYHRGLVPSRVDVLLTDGTMVFAISAECFWVLDIIAQHQSHPKLHKKYQHWTLENHGPEKPCILKGYNEEELIITKKYPAFDLPLSFIEFKVINKIIYLMTEEPDV